MNDLQRLKAMGITVWEVRNPQIFPNYQAAQVMVPDDCKLLFVSEHLPDIQTFPLFEKIVVSMKLSVAQTMYLPPAALQNVSHHKLTYVWFAGCPEQELPGAHLLTSPELSALESTPDAKQALWQRIKSTL